MTIVLFTNQFLNMLTVSEEYIKDLCKDTLSILDEEKLDEEEFLDWKDNKRKILSMLVVYVE